MDGPGRWLTFAAASTLIAILPGPGVANIVGYALNSGRRTAFAAIGGAVAGNLCAMTVSLAGAGALLEASPLAYKLLELAGAAYLVGLGMAGLLRRPPLPSGDPLFRPAISPRAAFAGSIAVSALNPKSVAFFAAFVPQFILGSEPYRVQCMLLVATFTCIVAVTDTLYALLALRVASLLQSASTTAWFRNAGGGVLIATGLFAACIGGAGR